MTLAVPGATGFVALAQRAVIDMSMSPDGERHAGQDDELLEPGSDLRMGIGDRSPILYKHRRTLIKGSGPPRGWALSLQGVSAEPSRRSTRRCAR